MTRLLQQCKREQSWFNVAFQPIKLQPLGREQAEDTRDDTAEVMVVDEGAFCTLREASLRNQRARVVGAAHWKFGTAIFRDSSLSEPASDMKDMTQGVRVRCVCVWSACTLPKRPSAHLSLPVLSEVCVFASSALLVLCFPLSWLLLLFLPFSLHVCVCLSVVERNPGQRRIGIA